MPESSGERTSRRRRQASKAPPLSKTARILERAGGVMLCTLAAAVPWLFGTTEDWAIRWMNWGTYAAGAVLAAAWALRLWSGVEKPPHSASAQERAARACFLGLNLLLLAFCAVAAWNARAVYLGVQGGFAYREHNPSLPTTYDLERTRLALLSFAAAFVLFWSLRAWLLWGWQRAALRGEDRQPSMSGTARFRALCWVLALNGMLVATQGILQRLSGSSRLLWMRPSWWGDALSCFGPFSYRGNAAEYLNLLWPVALGFWWLLSRERRREQGSARLLTDGPEMLLIPSIVMMIAASIISLSRGGALVAVGLLALMGLLLALQRGLGARGRIGISAFVAVIAASVWLLGWENLAERFQSAGLANLSGREEIYKNARLIAADYPVFGVGPGAFRTVYHLYRGAVAETWHGFLHDDWLETQVTFGWVGFGLVLAQLAALAAWALAPGKPRVGAVFSTTAALALVGCLIHAKFDFPFQTYSVFYTFVAVAALLLTASPSRR